jgi:hypothetical protein
VRTGPSSTYPRRSILADSRRRVRVINAVELFRFAHEYEGVRLPDDKEFFQHLYHAIKSFKCCKASICSNAPVTAIS